MTLPRRLGFALGVGQVVGWATTYYVPAVATAPVAAAFGVSQAVAIGAFSAALLVSGLCAPGVGRLIERHGGRPVLCGGTVLQAVGLLGLAASSEIVGWYAAWLVLGVGMAAGLYDAAFAAAGRVLGAGARPVITGITLLGGFASTVGWPMGAFLVAHGGWRTMLLAYAALLLVVNLPLYALVIPRVAAPVARVGAVGQGDGPAPGFAAFALFLVLRALVTVTVSVNLPGLMAGTGLGVADAVVMASLIGPAQVGTRLIEVAARGRLSPLASAWIGALLLPVAVVPIVVGFGTPFGAALVFALLYGGSNGILTIVRGSLPLFLWGAEGYATRIGRLALPNLMAQAAAPIAVAPLVSALPATVVFLGMGLLGVASAACLLPLRRPRS